MRYILLLFGVYCCSTSIIFIKIGSTNPIALSAYRLILGGLFLVPFAIRPWKKRTVTGRILLKQALPPAILLGIHFISWILGGRMTPSANASLVVNMVPAVMPLLLLVVVQEHINKAEAWGTVIALGGVLVLGLADLNLSKEYAMGDLMCFISMLLYAAYLVFARKNRNMSSIYLYVVPVYIIGGLFCLLIAAVLHLFGTEIAWIGPDLRMEWISILGLALIPTVFGHSLTNWAMTRIRGQVVVIINLAQFIFAGLMGFLILHEVPDYSFYVASVMVVAGAVTVVRHPHKST